MSLTLSNKGWRSFEDIVSPQSIVEASTPPKLLIYEFAVYTTPGEDTLGVPQAPTQDWVQVNKVSAADYIGGKDYILDELSNTTTFWLYTGTSYSDDPIKVIDTKVRSILVDFNTYNIVPLTLKTLSVIATNISKAEYDTDSDAAASYAMTEHRCLMLINDDTEKAKLFRTFIKWLAPESLNFVNTKIIEDTAWYGVLLEAEAIMLKEQGISMFIRSDVNSFLDNFMIGGDDAIQFYIKHYVAYEAKLITSLLYQKNMGQAQLDIITGALSSKLSELKFSTIIDAEAPKDNITNGKAFIVFTKQLANYSAAEIKDRIATFYIAFYKNGRYNRIPIGIYLAS